MNQLKPIVIELTAEQEAKLAEHFAIVLAEAAADRRGILAAQVWGPRVGRPAYIRVGFIPNHLAKKFEGAVKCAAPASRRSLK